MVGANKVAHTQSAVPKALPLEGLSVKIESQSKRKYKALVSREEECLLLLSTS